MVALAVPRLGASTAGAVLMRIGHGLVSLLLLLVFTWGIVRLTGDPVNFVVPPEASVDQRNAARARLGLDRPLVVQFFDYITGVMRGDLGVSYRRASLNTPVADAIIDRLPATIYMGLVALLLVLAIGVPLGIYAAYWRGSFFDQSARFIAALGQAVPDFWFGLMLIVVFAIGLGWFPSGGDGGIKHVILPAFTLAFSMIAGLIRLLRSSMIEVLSSDYVSMHRIKGMSEGEILWKHALRNAGLTTLTYMGMMIAGLLTGSVLVETIFNWPGIGRLFTEAVSFRDFPLIQGLILVFGATYIAMNLIVDVLYLLLNPRLR
jgi:ABC-type dipeptide/oligopeptide/nickel transport system permease component